MGMADRPAMARTMIRHRSRPNRYTAIDAAFVVPWQIGTTSIAVTHQGIVDRRGAGQSQLAGGDDHRTDANRHVDDRHEYAGLDGQ